MILSYKLSCYCQSNEGERKIHVNVASCEDKYFMALSAFQATIASINSERHVVKMQIMLIIRFRRRPAAESKEIMSKDTYPPCSCSSSL
mmetsp:Transcript_1792/g.2187  ORF Transcript_1792/g.2187 Transcript_1792/m.2187 type:complete len:89 (+) Transcript_1792:2808-3074(+)